MSYQTVYFFNTPLTSFDFSNKSCAKTTVIQILKPARFLTMYYKVLWRRERCRTARGEAGKAWKGPEAIRGVKPPEARPTRTLTPTPTPSSHQQPTNVGHAQFRAKIILRDQWLLVTSCAAQCFLSHRDTLSSGSAPGTTSLLLHTCENVQTATRAREASGTAVEVRVIA